MKRLLREPLVHFLIAGAALFALAGLYGGDDISDRSITIDEAQVQRMATQFQETWRRPPGPKELDGLIRDHIKDEIYFREAMRLGLDEDDPVIRRQLRNKMEFLATSAAENAPPTEAELATYYATNKARYAADPSYSFDQKYFGEDESAARAAVAALNAGKATPAKIISVPTEMQRAPASEISRAFGDGFAQSLRTLPTAKWVGPVQSGFGWHAVRILTRDAATVPPLENIIAQVSNDWRAETRKAREAAAYQALLDGYDINIKKP
jgi:peptidyl-prolyl cis-trans isomerase C